jgi:hypothetical protein
MLVLSKTQMLFAFGAELNAGDTVIAFPLMPVTDLVSVVPALRITESVGLITYSTLPLVDPLVPLVTVKLVVVGVDTTV